MRTSLREHLFGACLLIPLDTFAGGGTITGKVTYDGTAPPKAMLKIPANNAKDCGHAGRHLFHPISS